MMHTSTDPRAAESADVITFPCLFAMPGQSPA